MPHSKPHDRTTQPSPSSTLAPGLWLRRVAWLLCGVTFPLLWLGGLVTTTKSGMAVPDWPGTYGYNLFLYPWSTWFFGPWDLFVEHGHRLLASLAGLLTIALLMLLLQTDHRRWMKVIGIVALVGVIAQGVLGGLRVVLDERVLAMVHGSVGPLFFVLTVAIVVWTSRMWTNAKTVELPALNRLAWQAVAVGLLVYAQMIVGAMLRHMPATASPQSFLSVVKAHLFLAAVVAVAMLLLVRLATRSANPLGIRLTGWAMLLLVAAQLGLGVATWLTKYGTPVWAWGLLSASPDAAVADGWAQTHIVTAHQATGSLLLAATLVAAMLSWRYSPEPAKSIASPAASLPKGVATE